MSSILHCWPVRTVARVARHAVHRHHHRIGRKLAHAAPHVATRTVVRTVWVCTLAGAAGIGGLGAGGMLPGVPLNPLLMARGEAGGGGGGVFTPAGSSGFAGGSSPFGSGADVADLGGQTFDSAVLPAELVSNIQFGPEIPSSVADNRFPASVPNSAAPITHGTEAVPVSEPGTLAILATALVAFAFSPPPARYRVRINRK